ncbi:hypothetical protein [Mucisphaera calidilacus]|uniref:Tetratricopeptide repeat protein n=1 Tax=Mucisphaera calidilacus TaxID=2527982 RepID=A0A518C0Y9_9BACT|nr:hypothetical protein [Mucisphaera calidilacus]QDU72895.1 hypothetical protein Pan265_27710 [Mucisphaera calidilacus]
MCPYLTEPVDHLLRPLFEKRTINETMPGLVTQGPGDPELVNLVRDYVRQEPIASKPELVAALWLYVDELDESHKVSQGIETPTGSYWHAIMHRREGDFDNARHWYRRVGIHPAQSRITSAGGGAGSGTAIGPFDPIDFVDRVERAVRRGDTDLPELVAIQRREWRTLFEWCLEHL